MDFIRDTIEKIEEKIKSSLGTLAGQLTSFISSIVSGIRDGLTAVYNALSGYIGSVISWIKSTIEDVYSNVLAVAGKIVNGLKTAIENVVDGVKDTLKNITDSLTAQLKGVYESVKGYLETIVSKVGKFIRDGIDAAKEWVANAVDKVGGWISGVYDSVKSSLETTINKVGEWVGGVADSVREAYNSLETTVRDWLARQLEKLIALIETIGERFQTVKDWLANEVLKPVAEWIGEASQWSENFVGALETGFVNPVISNPDMPDALKMLLNSSVISKNLLLGAIGLLVIPAMIPLTLNTIYSPQFDKVAQSANAQVRASLLSPAQAVEGLHRGIIGYDRVYDTLARSGFTDGDINAMIAMYTRYIGIGDELSLWRRGLVSEDELYSDLRAQGFIDKRIQQLQQASEYLPNVPDLIRMAVRDVFSPEIAERGKIFTDFPPDFAKWAERLGLSEEWALNYWGAHWELPSPNQGYEMLHRGVIDEVELKQLLKAADYAPGWRDNLIAISYNPLTRVDIRRMHKLGILDREQVKLAYKELGYDDTKAEWLTVFTEKLNTVEAKAETVSNRELTRSQIERAYTTGMIDRETSTALLDAIGYDSFEIEFILTMKDWELEADNRDSKVEIVEKKYLAGHYNADEVWAELGKLGLTYVEIERSWDDIVKKSIVQPKSPSLADLQKFYKKGYISYDEFSHELERMGYSERWIKLYAKSA